MSFCVGPAGALRTPRSFKALAGICNRFESLFSAKTRLSDVVGAIVLCWQLRRSRFWTRLQQRGWRVRVDWTLKSSRHAYLDSACRRELAPAPDSLARRAVIQSNADRACEVLMAWATDVQLSCVLVKANLASGAQPSNDALWTWHVTATGVRYQRFTETTLSANESVKARADCFGSSSVRVSRRH